MLAPADALQGQNPQAGGEAFGFVLPVGDQAGGHHHHGRTGQAPGVLFAEQVGEGLQGFAQAHVVSEDATDLQLAQGLHPAQAFDLIGAQDSIQAIRGLRRLQADIAQALAQAAYPLAALPAQRQVFQGVEAGGVEGGQAHAGFTGLTQVEVAEGCQYRLEAAVGQGHLQAAPCFARRGGNLHQQLFIIAALVQLRRVEQFRMAAQYVEQDRQQAQALAIDLDAQFQVEPVAAAGLVDLRVPVVNLGEIEGEVVGVLDLPALLAQGGQVVEHEAQPGRFGSQFQQVAGALRQGLALPGGDLETQALKGLADLAFDLGVALYALAGGAIQAGDFLALPAAGANAVIVERQRRPVLVLALHSAGLRHVSAEFVAAQDQVGRGGNTVDDLLAQYSGGICRLGCSYCSIISGAGVGALTGRFAVTLSSRAKWPPSRKVSSPFFTVLLLCLSCSL
ncbi:hypothetical protein D3C80_790630 [compost metagenome]